jgi:hypothetical protein
MLQTFLSFAFETSKVHFKVQANLLEKWGIGSKWEKVWRWCNQKEKDNITLKVV